MRIKPQDASRIVDIPLKNWADVGDNAANVVREQIKEKRAIKGKYSTKYAIAKSSRKAARSQASTETGFVDFTLTGKMLENIKRQKIEKDGVTIGVIGTYASRASGLQRIGARKGQDWYIFNRKITNQVGLDTVKRLDKHFDRNIKQYARKPITLTIGKRF
tara:strand:+ start:2916 stop:3398 length:483 start_codon:yes stop_codon:yes gene_type:complete